MCDECGYKHDEENELMTIRDVFQLDQDRMISRMADAEMGDL
jgi:hypothetical protein